MVAVEDSLVAAEDSPVVVEDSLVAAGEAAAHMFQGAAVAAFCKTKKTSVIGKMMRGF